MLNVRDFGATGNGIDDDTNAIRSAFQAASGTRVIYVPIGRYKLTGPVSLVGNVSYATRLIGEVGATRGPSGATFELFHTAKVETLGFSGEIDNVEFLARTPSISTLLHIDAMRLSLAASSSSHVRISNCTFGASRMRGGAALRFAHPTSGGTPQVSEMAVRDCVFVGDREQDGITWDVGGNVKDFMIANSRFTGFGRAINHQMSSGYLSVRDCTFGLNRVDVFHQTAECVIECCNSEASDMLLLGEVGNNFGCVQVRGVSFAGFGDMWGRIVSYGGALRLIGNRLKCKDDEPKIAISYPHWSQDGCCSLISQQNHYVNTTRLPFYDGSQNRLDSSHKVKSQFDCIGPGHGPKTVKWV